ncbi:aminotransferase class I/II-fold pyridoxal phosphate-dependent enzyme, partial [Dolichospermum sp. ST_sed1]|nr:aminotransferase class I/II-fold pyridoxal phosphate-dependent enzyme [Dolichospermum sp. ST_sed1]
THDEQEFAKFKGCDAALYLPTGFAANEILGVAFSQLNAHIFSDELNHASIIDGLKLGKSSHQQKTIFPHNDVSALEVLLKKSNADFNVIYCESLYSMDGDIAQLKDFSKLCDKYRGILVVDEAHATGCFGQHGQGLLNALNINHKNVISISTCGKALATQGAFIGCNNLFRDYLINTARAFIYSTAPSPVVASFVKTAIDYTSKLEAERLHLSEISKNFREQLISNNFDIGLSETHIIPVIIGKAETALKISQTLREQNIHVKAIRPPTVAENSSRLRFSLHAGITELHLDQIIHQLIQVAN